MERHLSDVYAAQQECPAVADAVVLFRVWARQRGLSQVREERRRGGRERGVCLGKNDIIIYCACVINEVKAIEGKYTHTTLGKERLCCGFSRLLSHLRKKVLWIFCCKWIPHTIAWTITNTNILL